MKQLVWLAGMAAILGTSGSLADNVTPADLIAARQELEEESRLMKSELSALQQRQDSLERRTQQLGEMVASLRAENSSLRDTLARLNGSQVSRDDLKPLLHQVNEIERKRAEDKDLILREIRELSKIPLPAPVTPVAEEHPRSKSKGEKPLKSEKSPDPGSADEFSGEYYEYLVQPNETLGEIVSAFNKQYGLRLKIADVLKANPKMKDPKRLLVDQKLRIPVLK